MRILVAIDDTDNLENRGTGEIAQSIAKAVQRKGWGRTSIITRHQLLVHPDIRYTSHNSSQCFTVDLAGEYLDQVTGLAQTILDQECAPGSDPGLCVAVPGRIDSAAELLAFGQRAKLAVVPMADAFELAGRLGVHLSSHGGTGQGVIGALAGAGLRLWGNDGRMKGSLKFAKPDVVQRISDLLEHPDVDEVRSVTGGDVRLEDLVALCEEPKTVMLGGASVLLLSTAWESGPVSWLTLPRKQLRGY